MNKKEFEEIYKKYGEFDTIPDRFKFCMEVLKPCNCAEISKKCDIPLTTIMRIRDGKIISPNRVYLYAIADFFGVNFRWFIDSKFFPISIDLSLNECLTPNKDGEIDFHNLQADSKSGIVFKNVTEYEKAFEALIMYKDLIPTLLNCINDNDFLNKVVNSNINEIITKINLSNNKEKKESLQQLARKTRNTIPSYEELMNMMKNLDKENSSDGEDKNKK